MLTPPGPYQHPWARSRWILYGLDEPPYNLECKSIPIKTWEHHAINIAVGNASPDEWVQWIEEDKLDLSSLPCRLIFGDWVTPEEAIGIVRSKKYSRPVDYRVQQVFAQHPFSFEARWGARGFKVKITRGHILSLYDSLPHDIQKITPLDVDRSKGKTIISLVA
jgi:hypothetical protein